jgi:hypothetical protein
LIGLEALYNGLSLSRNNLRIHLDLDLAEWLEHLTVNAKVAAVPGSFPSSSDTVKSATDVAVLNKVHKKQKKHPPVNLRFAFKVLLFHSLSCIFEVRKMTTSTSDIELKKVVAEISGLS